MVSTEAVFQLSKGSLNNLAPLNTNDISVIALVVQLSKGLLKISALANIPDIVVIPLISQLLTIPLKEVHLLNMFRKLVTPDKSGASIASKFRFSQP